MNDNNLAQKIAAARAKLGSLQPDKTNTEQKYKYISADKILERGGDVLADFGITIIPSVMEYSVNSVDRGNGKSPRIDALLKMSFQVTDGQTDYIAYWCGCGSDYTTPDKAIYKAITSGHKYFLMKLLNVGVGNEDSEHETEPKPEQTKQPTRQAPQAEEKVLTAAGYVSRSVADKHNEMIAKDNYQAPPQMEDAPPWNIESIPTAKSVTVTMNGEIIEPRKSERAPAIGRFEDMQDTLDREYPEPPAPPVIEYSEPPSDLRYSPEKLKEYINLEAIKYSTADCNDKQKALCAAALSQCFSGDEGDRHELQFFLTGKKSMKDMTNGEIRAILKWLEPAKDAQGKYWPNGMSVREANAAVVYSMKQAGQAELIPS